MSYWIPSPELNQEYMKKRQRLWENLYFSIYSQENLNTIHTSCFNKCVKDFSSETISSNEKNCLVECRTNADHHQKNFLKYYSDLM